MALIYQSKHNGALHYLLVNGARYQVAEEPDGGLMLRLVEADAEATMDVFVLRVSGANTLHVRPQRLTDFADGEKR